MNIKSIVLAGVASLSLAGVASANPISGVNGSINYSAYDKNVSSAAVSVGVNEQVLPNLNVDESVRYEHFNNSRNDTHAEVGVSTSYRFVYGRAGVGYQFGNALGGNLSYWNAEAGIAVQPVKNLTVSVGDRYQDAFNTNLPFRTNSVVGRASYAFTPATAVGVNISRTYGDYRNTSVGVTLNHTF